MSHKQGTDFFISNTLPNTSNSACKYPKSPLNIHIIIDNFARSQAFSLPSNYRKSFEELYENIHTCISKTINVNTVSYFEHFHINVTK